MEKNSPLNQYYDGKKFCNFQEPKIIQKTNWDLIKWRFTRQSPQWPKWVEIPPHAPLAERVTGDKLTVSFINHATTLIQIAGLNILTDPIWSERCSPVSWMGPKRVHAPGIPFDELPPIDISLVSHDHYDHLDIATLRRLHERFLPDFYSGLNVGAYLQKKNKNFNTQDMQWWQTISIKNDVKLTFVPAQHWSSRGPLDFNRTLWGGFIITTPLHTIYFSGDTGFGEHFQKIAEKFPHITLAILPIGAYEPRWFMQHVHINPEEAVLAHINLKARFSLGVHFNTFELSDEKYNQPIDDLHIALQKHGINPSNFLTLLPGQSWQINVENGYYTESKSSQRVV